MTRDRKAAVLLPLVLLFSAATVLAAWSLTSREMTSYTGAIGTVRTNLATWTTGANSSSIGKAAQVLLKRADGRLAKAVARLSSPTTAKMVKKSLYALQDAAYYLRQAARLESKKNTAFQTFVTNSETSLVGEAKKLAVSASNYVMNNFTSKKATRKLLRAGGKTSKAAAKATAGKYAKAIALYNKAIQILANANLL